MTNSTDKNHFEEVLKVIGDEEIDEILHYVYNTGWCNGDMGERADMARESVITSTARAKIEAHYAAKIELAELKAQRGILRGFRRRDFALGSMYESAVLNRLGELDALIAAKEKI